jgi:hypothetical protein
MCSLTAVRLIHQNPMAMESANRPVRGLDADPGGATVRPHPDKGSAISTRSTGSDIELTSVSAGHRLGGAPRRNRTGDPILTMEPPGTAVQTAVSPGHARPSGPKLSVLLRQRYAFTTGSCAGRLAGVVAPPIEAPVDHPAGCSGGPAGRPLAPPGSPRPPKEQAPVAGTTSWSSASAGSPGSIPHHRSGRS